ncbi:MAG: hypothetical protein H6738_16440 [Alphaproteobacteria bacterium]|nr:hypothetical protein [Alphaproteobacteria bacterium]MCB9698370.1 hypothetical protein [Alphaproteobacteria bacterium]
MNAQLRALVLASWVGLAAHLWTLQPWTVDDAYIVFRYAENVLAGHGPVYNPGEWVEGVTSPAWLALMTGMAALGVPPELGAKALGVLAVALVPVVLARSPAGGEGRVAVVVAGTAGPLLAWSAGGLETAFAALVALLAWVGHLDGRAWSAPVAALAPLVRPELALIPALQLADLALARRWRSAARLLALTAVVGGLSEAVRLWTYGWPLPNPFYAKVGATSAQVERGLRYLYGYLPAGGAALALALPSARERRWVPVVGWIVLHVLFVVLVGGDGLPSWRPFVPVLPTVALAAGAAAGRWGRAGWLAGAVVAATQLASMVLDPRQAPRREGPLVGERGRELGLWLREHFPEDTLLAVDAAGAIPYYSGFVTIDMLGLCDEVVAHTDVRGMGHRLAGHDKANAAYVLSRSPDLIVFGAAPGHRQPRTRADDQLVASPAFREQYVFEWRPLPSGALGAWYRRNDAPPPTP